MKIEFLDEGMTKALLTRGFWRWKRQAEVVRDEHLRTDHPRKAYHWFMGWRHAAPAGSHERGIELNTSDQFEIHLLRERLLKQARKRRDKARAAERKAEQDAHWRRESAQWRSAPKVPKARLLRG